MTSIARLGTPARLQTIFRTNIQTSYAVGHWNQVQVNKAAAPLLMYDAIDDHRTRPEHAALDGLLLEVDDPFWETHAPPNGWNCRCGVIQLTGQEAEDLLGKSKPDKAPQIERRAWVNPRTGKTHKVPTDLDPGWDHNPGAGPLTELEQLLQEKIALLPSELQDAATRAPTSPAASAVVRQGGIEAEQVTSERINGRTPSGGDYLVAVYINEDGDPTPKNEASHVEELEFDAMNRLVARSIRKRG